MIIQAVEAARSGGPAPAELRLAWMCGESLLPEVGGVLDQDGALMLKMRVLSGIYRLVQKIRAAHGDEIHKLSDNERRTWKYLIDAGIW